MGGGRYGGPPQRANGTPVGSEAEATLPAGGSKTAEAFAPAPKSRNVFDLLGDE